MLIPLQQLIDRYRMKISGVIHAGAHLGEEADLYDECGIEDVLWIEANPELIVDLAENVAPFGHRVAQACLAPEPDLEITFHVSNNGQSSSILELGTHRRVHPEVHYTHDLRLTTSTLDEVVEGHDAHGWNFLNMDLQGFELGCLAGGPTTVEHLDYIYSEVNEDPLYQGGALLPELTAWLEARGFVMVEKELAGAQHRDRTAGKRWFGWGDALFVRSSLYG